MISISDSLLESVKINEGFNPQVYKCSMGFNTIGYGLNLDVASNQTLKEVICESVKNGNFNINDNFNVELSKLKVNQEWASDWLKNRLTEIDKQLSKNEVYNNLRIEYKEVLIEMAYQLGINGLMKFKRMWKALENINIRGANLDAHKEALDSNWHKQTPSRAEKVASGFLK